MKNVNKKSILLRTNIIICIILLAGFAAVSIIGYHLNTGMMKEDVEQVSILTSEGIYHQIDSFFAKPLNVSLTMANDTLLREYLSEEIERGDDAAYMEQLRNYLAAYREKYAYDSVFLVSAKTNNYYNFNGLNRVLEPGYFENEWYYNFLAQPEDYEINVDNDEADNDVITIFINCKIRNRDGSVAGVVGVGVRVDHLQALLGDYDKRFDLEARLMDHNGQIQISSAGTIHEHNINIFENSIYAPYKERFFQNDLQTRSFWIDGGRQENFLVVKYIENLDWYLIIEKDTKMINDYFQRQLLMGVVVIILVIALVLYMVNRIIWFYNKRIFKMTVSQELESANLLREATEGLYESIYEIDITNNRASNESTEQFFTSLGMSDTPLYDEALRKIAAKQVKEEFIDGYLKTFSTANVRKAYEQGISSLKYELMISLDGIKYYWIRITGRIFYWESDRSLRMIIYRQNIDEEKNREDRILAMARCDSLTGLYNKRSLEKMVNEVIKNTENKQTLHAFMIFDIDNFKSVNDNYGHATGDFVLREVAKVLRAHFRKADICSRFGGDEFAAFLVDIPGREWLSDKVGDLVRQLDKNVVTNGYVCKISISVGISIYPTAGDEFSLLYENADSALYKIKKSTKNGFAFYDISGEADKSDL